MRVGRLVTRRKPPIWGTYEPPEPVIEDAPVEPELSLPRPGDAFSRGGYMVGQLRPVVPSDQCPDIVRCRIYAHNHPWRDVVALLRTM